VKLPGPKVTSWLNGGLKEKDDGWGLLPSTIMLISMHIAIVPRKQRSLILRVVVPGVPGVAVVFGSPLLTLFAALWLQEFDTGLAAPAVSQSAACLVSCFRSIESANTAVGTVAESIPDTNTVVTRTNTINV
jgi:hypothetical protein